MHRSVVYSSDDYRRVAEVAQAAEAAGLHRIWTTEDMTHDGLIQAAMLAAETRRIRIGTGIAYAFTRNPVALGIAARNLSSYSEGRFTLGLGAGTRGIRRRYGASFDHPAPHLVEYADVVRKVWDSRGAINHSGQYYQVDIPSWRSGEDAVDYVPDLYGSGLNPTMIKYAARGYDGIALHPIAASDSYLDHVVLPAVKAGQSAGETRLAAWCIASVDHDPDLARARVSRSLAFYFSTPSYQPAAALAPWREAAASIAQAFEQAGSEVDWQHLAALVPEEMMADLAVWGSPVTAPAAIAQAERRLRDRGFDEVVFQAVTSGDADDHLKCALLVVAAAGS